MIQTKSLEIENLLLFKKQAFEFTPGVKLILGNNKTSSNSNPNGSGKSLFFSQLPELWLDEVMSGSSRDVTRSGSVRCTLQKGANEYLIERSFSPKEKISIYKNGVDLEIRELSEAKRTVKKILPYTKEEIQTFVYLDSRMPHPLVAGDTGARKSFFTNFFKLNALDYMRKTVRGQLSEIRANGLLYNELRSSLKEVKSQLDPKLNSKIKKFESLNDEIAELQTELQENLKVESLRSLRENYTEVRELMEKFSIIDEQSLDDHLDSIKSDRKSLKVMLQDWSRFTSWKESSADRTAAMSFLKKNSIANVEELAKSLLELKSNRVTIRESINAIEESNSKISSVNRKSKDLNESIDLATEKLESLKGSLGKCPTCGGDFDDEHAVKQVKTLKANVSAWKVELASLVIPKSISSEELESEMEALNKRIEKLSTSGVYLKEEQPEAPDISVEKIEAKLEKFERQRFNLEKAKDALELELTWKSLPVSVRKAGKDALLDKQNSLNELQLTRNKLEVEIAISTKALKDATTLRDKLIPLKEKISDKEPLELLEAAFSRKGVESILIRTICQKLQDQVNKYAKLIFPEDFTFEFDLETQFSITVRRKYAGKKEFVSDVRKLSGAESRLFSLVLLISLLTFVPVSRRSNILILDEPDANMGKDNLERFIAFLPVLQKVIPTIVVITPMSHLPYLVIEPEVFTVVKERSGISTIKNGAIT